MKIEKIKIKNYRNLDGVKVHLNSKSNYIVGENNIGKSNFLSLINTISNSRSFVDQDYFVEEKPIEVNLTLNLNESEYGILGDNFSPDESSKIQLKISQGIEEAYPTVIHVETQETIQYRHLRKINFMIYDTNSNPTQELSFNKNRGAGGFLNHMIQKYLSNKTSFLNQENIDGLIKHMNVHLKKIKSFEDFDISATVSPEPKDLLSKLVYLKDSNELPLSDSGNGIQFMAMAALNIFGKILELYNSKSTPFEEFLFITEMQETDVEEKNPTEKKFLPLILALDEPEVHLHPYKQRAMISYYKRILANEDKDFIELLQYCFDIDGLDGQLIVVTHSTDVLVDSYENIIRFYKIQRSETNSISGMDIKIKDNIEKHLLLHFSDVKEAFYSKCVLIMEGETEYGCIHDFATKLGVYYDDYGICFINAKGEKSARPLRNLLEKFGIPSVIIFDSDVNDGDKNSEKDVFFTQKICFEMDIVDNVIEGNSFDLLGKIANDIKPKATADTIDSDFLKSGYKKLFGKNNPEIESYDQKTLSDLSYEDDSEEYRSVYFSWYYKKKGIMTGRIIGKELPKEYIPECFKEALTRAKEIASDG